MPSSQLAASAIDQYQAMAEAIGSFRRILITTHVRPDGDALGSCAAMVLALKQKKISATVLLLSNLPAKYAFLFRDFDIPFVEAASCWPQKLNLDDFDALLVIDTGTWSQLPGLKDKILAWDKPRLIVDHHLTQEDWATHKLVVSTAAAAGEIVAELLRRWSITIDHRIATALFVAVATDTGWFQFSNTQPRTLRLAATLMEAGASVDDMYQLIYQNERTQRLVLQARALQTLELLADQRLAVMKLSKQDFATAHADVADAENLVNLPLQIRTVEVSLLLTEPEDGSAIRVNLRSKGKIDVAKFAEQFGGGGHARAAGLKMNAKLMEVHDAITGAMEEAVAGIQ